MKQTRFNVASRKIWKEWIQPILVAVIVMGTFRSAIADWNDVPSGSMLPTILVGDRIFVNKLAYDLKVPFTRWHLLEYDSPRPGDVVVLFSPDDEIRLVKRVVGVPGDRLEIRDGRLWINGEQVTYEPIDSDSDVMRRLPPAERQRYVFSNETLDGRPHPMLLRPGRPGRRWMSPITIPDGKYFMMGDNRDNSKDSRYFGLVDRDRIVGRATHVVISLDKDAHYRPRSGRFFRRLD